MKNKLIILLLFPAFVWAQKTSVIKGIVKDSRNKSIENVTVNYGKTGTTTDKKGYYEIRIPVDVKITLEFSHVGFNKLFKEFFTKKGAIVRFSPTLKSENEVLKEVVIKNESKDAQGIITIKAEKAKFPPRTLY